MSQLRSNFLNLRFYKYLRLGAILLGFAILLSIKLWGFPEPLDYGFHPGVDAEIAEHKEAIRTEDEDGKTWEFRKDGSIHIYDKDGNHTFLG